MRPDRLAIKEKLRHKLGIGRFEKERKKLEQAYQTGYEDTQRLADDLTAFFEQK